MRELRLCFEDDLEIEKLHQAEVEAKGKTESDIQTVEQNIDKKIEEQVDEAPDDTGFTDGTDDGSGVDDTQSDDGLSNPDEGDSSTADDSEKKDEDGSEEETPPDPPKSEEPEEDSNANDAADGDDDDKPEEPAGKLATESFRNLYIYEVSVEDFGVVSKLATKAVDLLAAVGSTLTHIGVAYGPTILSHVYKGLLFAITKLGQVLLNGISHLAHYLDRRINSFRNLKENIAGIKKMVSAIDSPKELPEGELFIRSKQVNLLKKQNNIDILKNISELSQFVDEAVKQLSNSIDSDVESIKHLISAYSSGHVKIPEQLMQLKIPSSILVKGEVGAYPAKNDAIETYHYRSLLPGDVLFIGHLPRKDLQGLDELRKAYNHSYMFLGFINKTFQKVDGLPYLEKDNLLSFLTQLEHLCDVCISHQSTYESILKKKKDLKISFKNYFQRLISGRNVSIKDSLIEEISLKAIFIDKAYLAGMIDIHDYAAKVINAAIAFSRDNAKKL